MEIELGTEVEEKQSYSPHSTETGGEWPLQGRGAQGPQGRTERVRGLEAGETPRTPHVGMASIAVQPAGRQHRRVRKARGGVE